MEDLAIGALTQALNGLALRQRYIAADTANIETPGYLAHRIDFESSLAAAVQEGDPAAAATSVQTSLEPTRVNGNNVNLDEETTNNIETVLRYQFATQAMNQQFQGVRAAMKVS